MFSQNVNCIVFGKYSIIFEKGKAEMACILIGKKICKNRSLKSKAKILSAGKTSALAFELL